MDLSQNQIFHSSFQASDNDFDVNKHINSDELNYSKNQNPTTLFEHMIWYIIVYNTEIFKHVFFFRYYKLR